MPMPFVEMYVCVCVCVCVCLCLSARQLENYCSLLLLSASYLRKFENNIGRVCMSRSQIKVKVILEGSRSLVRLWYILSRVVRLHLRWLNFLAFFLLKPKTNIACVRFPIVAFHMTIFSRFDTINERDRHPARHRMTAKAALVQEW